MKIENFQSKICVCAASTNLICAEIRRGNGEKHDKKTTAPIHSDNYVMHRFYLSFGFIDTEPFHDGCQPESGLSSIIGAHTKEEYL